MKRLTLCVGILCFIAADRACRAADQSTIEVQGKAQSVFIPDTVQVRYRVYAHGMTAKSALKKLVKSRAALEKRVAGLDGLKPTHHVGPCMELKDAKAGMEQMQAQIFQNAIGQGNNDDEDDDKLLRMGFTSTMEWKLTGESLEDAYEATDAIKRQLEEIGVIGDDDAKKKANKEEESEAEAGDEDVNDAAKDAKVRITDGPRFYFVKRLSEEELNGCAKLAFDDARKRAARMAVAAGQSLGGLVKLSDSVDMASRLTEMQESAIAMSAFFGQGGPTFDEDRNRPVNEVVSDELKPIVHGSVMSAVFMLE